MTLEEALNELCKGESLIVYLDNKPLRGCDNANDEEGWVDVPIVKVEQLRKKGKVSFVAFCKDEDGNVQRRELTKNKEE